jgi:chorismate dehydratase
VAKLRVGIVNFLNSRPLAWGFLKGRYDDRCDVAYLPPAQVADQLREGQLDVGLIPAIEVQRIPGLQVVPDLCVAAEHEVKSVLLVLQRPLAEVRRVALDLNSRTSAALVKILLADRYGLRPEYVPAQPELVKMFAHADAALVIGDPALKVDRERYQILDLAAEWRALTGLPAVFAVWAVAPHVKVEDLHPLLKGSLLSGLSAMAELVAAAAAELDLPAADVEHYLTKSLHYFLREEELASLAEYYRRAHAHGLIEAPRELALWAA